MLASPLNVLTTSHPRNVHDPRALAEILEKAEAHLANIKHPDPYIREFMMCFYVTKLNARPFQHPLRQEAPSGTFCNFYVSPGW